MSAKGWSVHVGLNKVDPAHYQGWDGTLNACEADAHDMEAIAKSKGHAKVTKLLTKQGTRKQVVAAIREAAGALASGDLFFLTYSGHGGQIPDRNGDEPDGLDETWCLYDGELVDDELYTELARFASGVRILVLSDSCHSGTVTRVGPGGTLVVQQDQPGARAMPAPIAQRTYLAHKDFYDGLQKEADPKAMAKMKAAVRLISGCQDAQTSLDGTFNGLFTATLLRVYGSGNFKQNYAKFAKAIRKLMPSEQQPRHYVIGPRDHDYDAQTPFTI